MATDDVKKEPEAVNTPKAIAVIYTGPSHNGLGLRHNTVYRDMLPGYIAAMIDRYDELAKFFVDVDEYAQGKGVFPRRSKEFIAAAELLKLIAKKEA